MRRSWGGGDLPVHRGVHINLPSAKESSPLQSSVLLDCQDIFCLRKIQKPKQLSKQGVLKEAITSNVVYLCLQNKLKINIKF